MSGPRRVATLLLPIIAVAMSVAVGAASPARATGNTAGTICVALVVDASTLGGPTATDCATVSKGATGVDVLQAAHDRIGFRSDGLICSINGLPADGCGAVDDSHYWAYLHRAPGATSWTYSTEGAGTYQPAAHSTEGWVWDDGHSELPANIPQATICHSASHHATPTPATHTSAPPPRRQHSRPSHAATPSSPATRATGRRHRQAASQTHKHRPADAASGHQHDQFTARLGISPSPSPARDPLSTAPGSSSGHGGLIGLVVGLVVVAGLGTATALRFRRSGS